MARALMATVVLAALGGQISILDPGPLAIENRDPTPAGPLAQEPRRLLHIQAAAVGADGKPVTDLRPDEFEVWINIFRVPIETVTVVSPSSERGRTIILMLDDLAVEPALALRVKDIAKRFVTRLAPGDEMAIVPANGGSFKTTTERAHLLQSIDRYTGRAAGVMPFDTLGPHVLNTLTSISRQFSEVAGTKVIVGIGAGWLFDTPVVPSSIGRDVREEWIAAMRAMATANASLYVIEPGGVGTAPVATGGNRGLAGETGGHAFLHTNDFDGVIDRILSETSHYYVLDLVDPPTGRKAEFREVDVRVTRKGVTVRARRYIPGSR